MKRRLIAKATDHASTVRFPPGMLDQLSIVAAENGHSRNTEIICMLEDGLHRASKKSLTRGYVADKK